MSNSVYKKLKKQNGERFAQTLRDFHNGLLEIPDIVEIARHAGRNAEPLLPYFMSLMTANDNPAPDVPGNPFTLLDQAGYDAFYADTLEKQNSIRSYFKKGELLCTFNDSARYKNYYIVHAIKKDVDNIDRKEFDGQEERQDKYGTSVISIQMSKDGGFISIKNRYNHTVSGCDNTFNSNPDNIITGLTNSLKAYFNVDFSATDAPLPDNFVAMGERVFKYSYEAGNIYYADQAWATGGRIHTVNKRNGDALFDEFLFDNKTKMFTNIDPNSNDSFVHDFNKYYGGNQSLKVKNGNLTLNGDILIGAEASRITTINLPEIKAIKDNFLRYASSLTSVTMNNLETMRDECFKDAKSLTSVTMNNLKSMRNRCFVIAESLTSVTMNNLETMGDGCFKDARSLTSVTMNNLETMGDKCFMNAQSLTSVTMNNLKYMGNECFRSAGSLTSVTVNNLETMKDECFRSAGSLTSVTMNNLKSMGAWCFENISCSKPLIKKNHPLHLARFAL